MFVFKGSTFRHLEQILQATVMSNFQSRKLSMTEGGIDELATLWVQCNTDYATSYDCLFGLVVSVVDIYELYEKFHNKIIKISSSLLF